MRRRLLIWGYGSWLWRAALFLGIALAVYHMFFKLLGIVLMLVELLWFIGLPIWREWQEWWRRRDQAAPGKTLLTAAGLLMLSALLVLPWRTAVDVPSVLEAASSTALYPPLSARLKQLHVRDGQAVQQGELLLELESPDLESRQAIVRQEIQILQLQLRRQAGRSETVGDAAVLEQRLATSVAEYRGLDAQRERLQLRAPESGVVRDLQPNLAPGRWLKPGDPLLRVVAPGVRLRGYLAEDGLWRVQPGSEGRFIADDPARAALAVRLDDVDDTGVAYLQLEALASDHHGPIAVRRDAQHRAAPLQAQYGARLSLLEAADEPSLPVRGVVVLEGTGQSILGATWRRLAALGVRESGF